MKIALGGLLLVFLGLLSAPPPPAPAASGGAGLRAVVAGAVLTQGFGCTALALEPVDAGCPQGHFHSGVDLAAPTGTPVRAVAGGTVRVVRSAVGYGLHLLERTPDGVLVIYGHLSEVRAVDGELVGEGQEIALVGASGNATGPHLHLEIRVGGVPVDPAAWISGRAMVPRPRPDPAERGITRSREVATWSTR